LSAAPASPSGMCAPHLQDALDQLMALPYDAFERGPPNVPCHEQRVEYLQQIKALDAAPRDPQVRPLGTRSG
jgi:hypothetical protein